MATKIPSSARLGFTLNTGTHPSSGAMIKRSVSLGYIMPNAATNAIGTVANAVKTLFEKPVVLVSLVETSSIV